MVFLSSLLARFLDTFLTTILPIFILVYIKQSIRKKRNIILFNSLVVIATSMPVLINLIYTINYGEISIKLLVGKIIVHIVEIAVIFSLIYFTSNMKNLDKISSTFINYIIYDLVCMMVLNSETLSELIEFNISLAIGLILNVAIVHVIIFIGYCLIISLGFKILLKKNDDIFIDNKNNE